jgi:hypothetical protein
VGRERVRLELSHGDIGLRDFNGFDEEGRGREDLKSGRRIRSDLAVAANRGDS